MDLLSYSRTSTLRRDSLSALQWLQYTLCSSTLLWAHWAACSLFKIYMTCLLSAVCSSSNRFLFVCRSYLLLFSLHIFLSSLSLFITLFLFLSFFPFSLFFPFSRSLLKLFFSFYFSFSLKIFFSLFLVLSAYFFTLSFYSAVPISLSLLSLTHYLQASAAAHQPYPSSGTAACLPACSAVCAASCWGRRSSWPSRRSTVESAWQTKKRWPLGSSSSCRSGTRMKMIENNSSTYQAAPFWLSTVLIKLKPCFYLSKFLFFNCLTMFISWLILVRLKRTNFFWKRPIYPSFAILSLAKPTQTVYFRSRMFEYGNFTFWFAENVGDSTGCSTERYT